MAKGHALSGFPEWLPEQELVQQHLIGIVRRQYELHGFTPITTRSVESLDDLLSKGETDKEIYVLNRLQAEPGDDDAKVGLHYDLTVPFARYVVENQGKLAFPFRRYQIQPAWRGERPQLGRYREFLQADVDIIGQGSLDVRYDGELIAILRDTLRAMRLPRARLLVNNRKLLEGFYRGLGIEEIAATLRVVDKLAKIGARGVREVLTTKGGLSGEQADACLGLATIECATVDELARVRALGVSHELLDRGLDELAAVMTRAPSVEGVDVVGALHIARGFDYYTGTVVEGMLTDHPSFGSICSGGRYDNLASHGSKTPLPGVGVSIGITRIMGYGEHLGLFKQARRTPAQVLVIVHDEASRSRSDEAARALRARGIACIVADAAQAYGKQIRAAERLGIPYVWFPPREAEAHTVKDIRNGAQAEADLEAWTPAADAAMFAG